MTDVRRRARVRPQHREADIFAAAVVDSPSYTGPELWTVAEGVMVPGKPTREHTNIARARIEYDNAVRTLNQTGRAVIAGRVYGPDFDARRIAREVEARGGLPREVINAWNISQLASGLPTIDIYSADREPLTAYARARRIVDYLEARDAQTRR